MINGIKERRRMIDLLQYFILIETFDEFFKKIMLEYFSTNVN